MRDRYAAETDDRGSTLMELVVGMALLAIFLSIFTGVMLMMSRSVGKVEAAAGSAKQVDSVFLLLDRTLHYADAIGVPGRAGATNDWHVEFETTTDSVHRCTQLRVHGTAFQQRSWTTDGTAYASVSAWTTLAPNVTNGADGDTSPTRPFSTPPLAGSGRQQLTVTIAASAATSASTSAALTHSMTFTALNSGATSSAVCRQVAVDQLS